MSKWMRPQLWAIATAFAIRLLPTIEVRPLLLANGV